MTRMRAIDRSLEDLESWTTTSSEWIWRGYHLSVVRRRHVGFVWTAKKGPFRRSGEYQKLSRAQKAAEAAAAKHFEVAG